MWEGRLVGGERGECKVFGGRGTAAWGFFEGGITAGLDGRIRSGAVMRYFGETFGARKSSVNITTSTTDPIPKTQNLA